VALGFALIRGLPVFIGHNVTVAGAVGLALAPEEGVGLPVLAKPRPDIVRHVSLLDSFLDSRIRSGV
jgi:hypothetical protein